LVLIQLCSPGAINGRTSLGCRAASYYLSATCNGTMEHLGGSQRGASRRAGTVTAGQSVASTMTKRFGTLSEVRHGFYPVTVNLYEVRSCLLYPPKADMCGARAKLRCEPITTALTGANLPVRRKWALEDHGAAFDARVPAERTDGRGEEVARGRSPRCVVRVTRRGFCPSPAPPARRQPREPAAGPSRRRARFGHRAL